MSDQIDVTSLTTNTFIVRPVGGNPLAGTYSTQMGMINFAPDQSLASGTTYEVVLPVGGIRDVVGNGLAQGFTSRFATGGSVEEGTNNITARWPFDNHTDDVSGNGHSAQLLNGAAFSTNFIEGIAAMGLDGTNDHASAGVIPLGDQITITLWAFVAQGATNIQTLSANSGGGFSANGFRLFVNSFQTANRRILVETGNGTAGSAFSTTSNVFELGEWNHIAWVADRIGGTGKLFYRGAQVASGLVRNDFSTNGILTIGAFSNGTFGLRGGIDDVRIYGRILSTNEIAALAASPNSPPVIQSLVASTTTPLVGQVVTFTNISTDTNFSDTLTYSFSFGDGSPATAFSTNRTAQHSFNSPGRYTVLTRVHDGSVTVSQTLLVIVHHPATALNAGASAQIICDPARQRVWCVNPDSDTISRVHALSLAKESEIAVGAKPRSLALRPNGATLWIACEGSDELWVVDAASGGPGHQHKYRLRRRAHSPCVRTKWRGALRGRARQKVAQVESGHTGRYWANAA